MHARARARAACSKRTRTCACACAWRARGVRHANVCVCEQALLVYNANLQDDKKDDDKDGVSDVKQLDGTALVQRKAKLAAAAVQDPQKLARAVGGLYGGWIAVQAGA